MMLCLIGAAVSAAPLWLVVGASDASPFAIAKKAKSLSVAFPSGMVVQSSDCGQLPVVFAWVSESASAAEAAQSALAKMRETVKDAYIKKCEVKPRSLLAYGITAVDASIADIPTDAVNWDPTDAISSVLPMPDGRALAIVRYFDKKQPHDPIEGRRERVVLLLPPKGEQLTLEENCPSVGAVSMRQGKLVFQCAREQAGNHLLHEVLAFSVAGKMLAQVPRCRLPRWTGRSELACSEEEVGADGGLRLRTKHVGVTSE